jgi:hypothetical protein
LSAEDRDVFLRIIRQVIVDTTSNLLAIVDGVSRLPQVEGEFMLSYDGEALNGELQDAFLELEERR